MGRDAYKYWALPKLQQYQDLTVWGQEFFRSSRHGAGQQHEVF